MKTALELAIANVLREANDLGSIDVSDYEIERLSVLFSSVSELSPKSRTMFFDSVSKIMKAIREQLNRQKSDLFLSLLNKKVILN